jgi:hypothetical protein
MPIKVNIASVDKTKYVERGSLKIDNILTRQVDTCSFKIVSHTGHAYIPAVGDEVIVYDNDGVTKLFAGHIIKLVDSSENYKTGSYDIMCKDYTDVMDGKLVVEVYNTKTVNEIIADIISQYLPAGFTGTNVNCTKTVNYISFNYEQPSKALQRLADLVNYDWYVDYDKDIHFFDKESNSAPFSLTDTSNNYVYSSLKIEKDKSQMRNVVFVRGGEYLGNTITAELVADGEQVNFPLAYKFSGLVVTVNGTNKTVGIDYISNAADYDCLHNFQEKIVKFPDATKPTVGQIVKAIGKPYLPVIVKVTDNVSSSAYGEKQYKIIDKSIKSKEGARDRAKADLQSYKDVLSEGGFQTITSGLRSGQYINVQSTARTLDEDFLINKVSMVLWNDKQFIYNVSLVSKQTFGIIEFLQKLLMNDNSQIEINADEIIDIIESLYEDVSISESIAVATNKSITEGAVLSETTTAYNHTPPFKWCPYSHKSFSFRWNLSSWS